MTRTRRHLLVPAALTIGLAAGACGGDEAAPPATTAGPTTEATAAAPTTGTSGATTGGDVAPDLSNVCPAMIAIQSDWFPEAEHGALYYLIGDDYEIDTEDKIVRGSMVLDGVDLGVDIEVRAGGPAIASPTIAAEMYSDDSLIFGYSTTDTQILRYKNAPMLSVVAPLETNPQIVYWDPETYPGVTTLAELGELGVTINVFGGGTFYNVFVAQGIWSADQIDPSYDGSPGRFVAEGNIAQQGFASAEPWVYKHQVEEYGRDIAFQTLNDAGFRVYSQTIAIRPDDLEELRPCLEKIVPVFQRAVVGYYADPDRTNALIVEAVEKYDTFWTYPAELAAFSTAAQIELGFAGNGGDDTVGNMEAERIQSIIDALREADMDVPDDITAEILFTNEFIDPTIGF